MGSTLVSAIRKNLIIPRTGRAYGRRIAVNQIADNIFLLTSVVQQLNTVVIIDKDYLVVIDPGFFPGEIAEIRKFLQPWETPSRTRLLALTHSHFDHIAGVPYFPEYAVLTSDAWDRGNERHAIRRLEQFDTEFYVDRPWEPGHLTPLTPQYAVRHGQSLGPFLFLQTPGHTHDSLSIVYEHVIGVGDYLSSLEFPFINASLKDYRNSLALIAGTVRQHSLTTLLSQHGPPAYGTEIPTRAALARNYIEQMCEIVETAHHSGWSWEKTLSQAPDVLFQNRPIPLGLIPAHERNLQTIWAEYAQEHTLSTRHPESGGSPGD